MPDTDTPDGPAKPPDAVSVEDVVNAVLDTEGLAGDEREARREQLLASPAAREAAQFVSRLEQTGRADLPGGSVEVVREPQGDAGRLRAAAAALREAAQAATPGPWGLGNGATIATDVEQSSRGSYSCTFQIAELVEDDDRLREGDTSAGEPAMVDNPASTEDDGRYIVLAQPAVGLAVAGWLDAHAEVAEVGQGVCDPEALAVAEAILTARDALEHAFEVAEGAR